MFKQGVLFCVAFCVVIEARPWQFLPAVPGFVPVYIQTGDTPLELINPELAEAFHELPSGRSASKQIDASPEEMADQPRDEIPEQTRDEVPEQTRDEVPEQPKDEVPEQPRDETDQPRDELPSPAEETVDDHHHTKKLLEKTISSEVSKPIERR